MTGMSVKKWSDEAWDSAAHIYEAILNLPFVKELADGTLARERFLRYIGQDSLYIAEYCRVLAHIASRLNDSALAASFIGFASDGVAVEKELHSFFVSGAPAEMSPACLFYTSLLKAQAYEDVAVEAAAVLPCFWIYRQVGRHIVEKHCADSNPYSKWILTYADPAFDISTDKAIEICDRLAAETNGVIRRKMTDIFTQCTRMEWLFWHSAYEDLRWDNRL